MDELAVASLMQLAEPLTALSINHLMPATRRKLLGDTLSVNAYPTRYGGFVYVGAPAYDMPDEGDLATLFMLAEKAGVAWLKFDLNAAIIDGITVFDDEAETP